VRSVAQFPSTTVTRLQYLSSCIQCLHLLPLPSDEPSTLSPLVDLLLHLLAIPLLSNQPISAIDINTEATQQPHWNHVPLYSLPKNLHLPLQSNKQLDHPSILLLPLRNPNINQFKIDQSHTQLHHLHQRNHISPLS
jgi:hypothetical protein